MPNMCGRVIQSSGPLQYASVDGLNVRDSRVHNYPPRWNAAPSRDLLVIRHNHRTAEVSLDPIRWGLIHSKALTVPHSANKRTETSPEASSAPLPARDVAYEESKGLFCHHKT